MREGLSGVAEDLAALVVQYLGIIRDDLSYPVERRYAGLAFRGIVTQNRVPGAWADHGDLFYILSQRQDPVLVFEKGHALAGDLTGESPVLAAVNVFFPPCDVDIWIVKEPEQVFHPQHSRAGETYHRDVEPSRFDKLLKPALPLVMREIVQLKIDAGLKPHRHRFFSRFGEIMVVVKALDGGKI